MSLISLRKQARQLADQQVPQWTQILSCEKQKKMEADKEMFQSFMGRIIYLFHTRPDIACTVSMISQFVHGLREIHLLVAHRVL